MKDCQGQDIDIGDIVVVAHRKGSSQWLTETRVVALKEVKQWQLLVERPILERKGKKGFVQYQYRGQERAIMIIAKGSGGNVPVTVTPIVEGDEDPNSVHQVSPYDPVPGVRW